MSRGLEDLGKKGVTADTGELFILEAGLELGLGLEELGRGETQPGREQSLGNRKAKKYRRSSEYVSVFVGEARRAGVKNRQGVWRDGSQSRPLHVGKHYEYVAESCQETRLLTFGVHSGSETTGVCGESEWTGECGHWWQ